MHFVRSSRALAVLGLSLGCSSRAVELDAPVATPPDDATTFVRDGNIADVWADGSRLYWAVERAPGSTTLRGCGATACAATTLTYDQPEQDSATLAPAPGAQRVYWFTTGDLRTCPATGCDGKPQVVVLAPLKFGLETWGQTAGDANHVCWPDYDATYCCASSGCEAVPNLLTLVPAQSLRVRDGYVYWSSSSVDGTGTSSAYRANLDGPAVPALVVKVAGSWGEIAVNSSALYLLPEFNASSGPLVCTLPQCAAGPTALVSDSRTLTGIGMQQLQADDSHVYWIEASEQGRTLKRCSVASCAEPESVLPDGTNVGQFALGSDTVYWLDYAVPDPTVQTPPNRPIRRVPK